MEYKKQFAFNRLFNLYIIIGIIFLISVWPLIQANELGLGISFLVIGLFFLIAPAVIMPCFYIFEKKGVTLLYIFFPNECYLWENIYSVEVSDDGSSRHNFLDLLFSGIFQINGYVEGKHRFYMQGHIRRSRRTKRLLEQYWDGKITGYFLDDVKKWFNKRRRKQQLKIKTYLEGEAASAEHELRKNVKKWAEPYISEAKLYNFELRTKFLYVTEDFEELNSRPHNNYTFTVVTEIARPNERDENRILCIETKLLFVRLGKASYRSVRNRYAKEEFCIAADNALKEVKEKAAEIYRDGY